MVRFKQNISLINTHKPQFDEVPWGTAQASSSEIAGGTVPSEQLSPAPALPTPVGLASSL